MCIRDRSSNMSKAKELVIKKGKDKFVATDGWFHSWKKKENIVSNKLMVNRKTPTYRTQELDNGWPKISSEYPPCSVHNVDETGIYYCDLPQHTNLFKSKDAKGSKTTKLCITFLCYVNMSVKKKNFWLLEKQSALNLTKE